MMIAFPSRKINYKRPPTKIVISTCPPIFIFFFFFFGEQLVIIREKLNRNILILWGTNIGSKAFWRSHICYWISTTKQKVATFDKKKKGTRAAIINHLYVCIQMSKIILQQRNTTYLKFSIYVIKVFFLQQIQLNCELINGIWDLKV